MVEFGEWLYEGVLKAVPHRHFTFSIPKILRRYFLYDRKLLSELSRCTWKSLKAFLEIAVLKQEATPGAVIAIQTFGDFLNFNPPRRINPHCHVLCTDGAFYESGSFRVAPPLDTEPMEKIFQHEVLGMLLGKGKIMEEVVKLIMSWRHSGFNIHCGPRIQPGDDEAMENLARYVVRASFSQERMTYIPDESKVVYTGPRTGRARKPLMRWSGMAAMCSHVPNKGEQMVRYYGYYSNVCRG